MFRRSLADFEIYRSTIYSSLPKQHSPVLRGKERRATTLVRAAVELANVYFAPIVLKKSAN